MCRHARRDPDSAAARTAGRDPGPPPPAGPGVTPTPRGRARLVLLVLTATLVAACSGGANGKVRRDLSAQAQATASLRERMEQVEAALEELRKQADAKAQQGERLRNVEEAAKGLSGRLRATEQRSAGLGDSVGDTRDELEALRSRLAAERVARSAETGELDQRLDRLLARVESLEPLVNQLRRDLAALRSAHNLLKQRFVTHSRHPPG